MNDYSDLLFLIGAIAIYALLVTNTNQTMLQNDRMLVTTEMEYGAVSVAQNIVEEARWMKYGEISESKLESINTNTNYDVKVEINPENLPGSDKSNRKIDITVTEKGNSKGANVTMSYIKTDRD